MLDSGAIRSVEFGVNRTDRDKTKVDKGYYLTLKGYDGSADYTMTVPDQYLPILLPSPSLAWAMYSAMTL